jgi:hypothetical protein
MPKWKTIISLLPKILLSILPLQHHGVEVFPYQDHEEDKSWRQKKELKRRRVEGKTRRKRRQGVDDQKIKRRETQVKKMIVLDLMT